MLHLHCYLVAIVGNSYTIFTPSDMCIYAHILHNIETLVRQKKLKKKIATVVNAACQGNLFACHFGQLWP
jgi:hypothetical protein